MSLSLHPLVFALVALAVAFIYYLWFYVSALAVLLGAELNAEIEHASPYGKDPGEKVAGEKEKITNCDVDVELPKAGRNPAA